MFYACRLAKEGYFGGDPLKVLKSPVNIVLGILNYEAFNMDYEKAYENLNRKES